MCSCTAEFEGRKRSAARTTAATAVREAEVQVGALGGAGGAVGAVGAVSDGGRHRWFFLLLLLLCCCCVLLLCVAV